MRSFNKVLALGFILATISACTRKDDKKAEVGVTPNSIAVPGGQNDFSIDNQIQEGKLERRELIAPQSAVQSLRGIPGSRRDDLDTVLVSCLSREEIGRKMIREGLVMVPDSQLLAVGNFSRKKQNTLLTCRQDRLSNEPLELDRGDRLGRQSDRKIRLKIGESRIEKIITSKNRFRRSETLSVQITCSADLGSGLRSGQNGIHLNSGSKILVVERDLKIRVPRFDDSDLSEERGFQDERRDLGRGPRRDQDQDDFQNRGQERLQDRFADGREDFFDITLISCGDFSPRFTR